MAQPSLRTMIKQAGGQLASTSVQEAQQQIGAPVTSPLQAATLGAEPDQAKMVGTPNQKTNALRQVVSGTQNLATAQREQQALTKANQQQQQEITGAQGAQGLTGLQQAIQAAAQQGVSGAVQQATNTPQTLKAAKQSTPDLQSVADTLVGAKTPQEQDAALGKYAQILGRAPTQDDINQLVGGAQGVAGVAGATAGANVSGLTVGKLTPEVQTSASQLLGHDTSGMSVNDLLTEINNQISKEYSSTQSLQQQANDPMMGASERAEARSRLKDMGAIGVTSAEGSMDKLADQIQAADTVQFNGQDMSVENLLNNDFVAGTVANYLANPTSAEAKQLEQNEPDLVKFIKQYQGVLTPAVQSLGSEIPKLAQYQASNQKLAQVDTGTGQTLQVPKNIMDVVHPGWDQFGTPSLDYHDSGILTVMNSPAYTGAQRQTALDNITQAANINPQYAQQIAGMNSQQVSDVFVKNADNTQSLLKQAKAVQNINPANANMDEVASAMGFDSQQDAQDQITEALTRQNAGMGNVDLNKLGIQLNPDNTINWQATTQNLKNNTPQDLNQLLAPGNQSIAQIMQDSVRKLNAQPGDPHGLFDTLKPVLTDGGALDIDKIHQVLPNMDADAMSHLVDSDYWKNITPEAQQAVLQEHDKQFGERIDSEVNSLSTGKGVHSLSGALQEISQPTDIRDNSGLQRYKTNVTDINNVISGLQNMKQSTDKNKETLNSQQLQQTIDSLRQKLNQYKADTDKNQETRMQMAARNAPETLSTMPGFRGVPAGGTIGGGGGDSTTTLQKLLNPITSAPGKVTQTLRKTLGI